MARRIINIGSSPNAKDGDIIRDAFNKTNQNFEELYALTGGTESALTELAQDYAAEMFINATHSGVALTYDDENNKLSISTNFDGNYNNLSNKPSIPADVSELTDTTGLLGGNGITVITPDDTEINGITTLVFTGVGVNATSAGNAVTLDITGSGNANTGDFTFTAGDASLPPGSTMTLSTYQSGGNKESKLTLSTGGISSLDVGNNLRIRIGNGTGFEKDWTFDAVGGLQFPDATTQLTAYTGNKLFNGAYEVTLDNNGNLTLPVDSVIQQRQSFVKTTNSTVTAATPTVVWTSTVNYISSAKLVIQVEGDEVGDITGWHSQACEAIIACRGYANVYGGPGGDPQMIVYGVVHTSVDPLVTFTVQRNPTTKMVEIVGTPTAAAAGGAIIKIHSVEMSTRD